MIRGERLAPPRTPSSRKPGGFSGVDCEIARFGLNRFREGIG
jgi:hypothetical protein